MAEYRNPNEKSVHAASTFAGDDLVKGASQPVETTPEPENSVEETAEVSEANEKKSKKKNGEVQTPEVGV